MSDSLARSVRSTQMYNAGRSDSPAALSRYWKGMVFAVENRSHLKEVHRDILICLLALYKVKLLG